MDPWFVVGVVLTVGKIKLALTENHQNYCLLLKNQQEDCCDTKEVITLRTAPYSLSLEVLQLHIFKCPKNRFLISGRKSNFSEILRTRFLIPTLTPLLFWMAKECLKQIHCIININVELVYLHFCSQQRCSDAKTGDFIPLC